MNSTSTGFICWKFLKSFRKGEFRIVVGYFILFILDAHFCYFPGILGSTKYYLFGISTNLIQTW